MLKQSSSELGLVWVGFGCKGGRKPESVPGLLCCVLTVVLPTLHPFVGADTNATMCCSCGET